MKISSKFLLLVVSFVFMALAFANTYEVVFNRDITLATSIKKMTTQNQIGAVIQQFDIKPEGGRTFHNARYDKLSRLQIPSIGANLYLEEKRFIDHTWYFRPSYGHYVGLNKDDQGTTVDYLIYASSNWRNIPSPNQIEQGAAVRLFHDGNHTTEFKVAEKKVLPLDTTFVASKSDRRQIVLLIEKPADKVYFAYSLEIRE